MKKYTIVPKSEATRQHELKNYGLFSLYRWGTDRPNDYVAVVINDCRKLDILWDNNHGPRYNWGDEFPGLYTFLYLLTGTTVERALPALEEFFLRSSLHLNKEATPK